MSKRAWASRVVTVGSPAAPPQSDPYGLMPETQGSGFLAAALADPQDFVAQRLQTMESRDRSAAARFRRDFTVSGGPLELQVWGKR